MFQTFDAKTSPDQGRKRVADLRASFPALGVDGILVPRADEFLGEYVPACAERLAWLTGFTGSAGVALVLEDRAVVFVDGRYTAQLAQQVDSGTFAAGDLVAMPPAQWIESGEAPGIRLGIDPWLHTSGEVQRLRAALAAVGGKLVCLEGNPIDAIWTDRPAAPVGAISMQDLSHAGRAASEKIDEMRATVERNAASAVVVTDPSSVAWIFNIRGRDVPHTPHPLARAIIPASDRPVLFVDNAKLGAEQKAALAGICRLEGPEAFGRTLTEMAGPGAAIMLDPGLAPYAIAQIVEGAGGKVMEAPDPARLPRATKNRTEIQGARAAHLQDGAAVVGYLAWLDRQAPGTLDEIAATRELEAARTRMGEKTQMPLRDIAFDTIAGAGPHGAVIHYRVTEKTNRTLQPGELFLLDSGAQYAAGTTDITRTVPIGEVPAEARRFFTLVLKGMIAISTLRFPAGTRGIDIDAFARIALWQAGADYAHGTGHGVGSYLSVHEGPQSISRRGMQELLPGMILSNEPGYYRNGAFGIRIENLIVVHEAREIGGGDKPMLGFETLTLVPIDRRLIDTALLAAAEIEWLDRYHETVRREILPLLDEGETKLWLEKATEPLGRKPGVGDGNSGSA